MTKENALFLLLIILTACSTSSRESPPKAPVKLVEEVLFGKTIADPYRYMEDLNDSTVANWMKRQSDYSRRILDQLPGRVDLLAMMRELDGRKSETIYGLEITENDRYFYQKVTPDDEVAKLFWRQGFEGKEQLLFSPDTYKIDSLTYTISAHYPSHDGSKVAIEVAPNGSESSELIVLNVDTREQYPEVIDRCWFAEVSWLPDGEQFFYIRLNSKDVHDMEAELNSKVYLHKLRDSPDIDPIFLSRETHLELGIQEEDFPMISYSKESNKLIGYSLTTDSRQRAFIASPREIATGKVSWRPLFDKEDQVHEFVLSKSHIYVYTPKDASNFKLLRVPIEAPDLSKAEEIIPEDKQRPLEAFEVTSDGLYYIKSVNGVQCELFHKGDDGVEHKIELPKSAGRIYLLSKGIMHPDIWVYSTSWNAELKRYRYVRATGEFIEENLSTVADYPEFDELVVEEVMVKSHDGVEVPLSLVYNKGVKKDAANPVVMLGYGAYGQVVGPFFSPTYLVTTMKGSIFAVAHVRGGGELGDDWHKGGFKQTKPNTWKDLIACAEYLIEQKYSSPGHIAITGASAGGILVGRAITERPDLFAAAIPEVGCLNPMRQEFSPNGPVNVPEFGTVMDSAECMALYEMDSYHHVEDGVAYPATLVTAGMNDARVIAWQPAKFAARLQAANASDNPVLFYADYEAGHGIGDSKSKYFESMSDIFAFALWQTGHPDFQ